jgi:voltage-gated potassium channel
MQHGTKRVLRKYFLLAAIALAIFVAAILVFVYVENKSFHDAIFDVACSAVYVQCGANTTIVGKIANILVGLATIGIVVFFVTVGVEGFVKTEFGGRKMEKRMDRMKNHFIVCGYGALGKTVCEALEKAGAEYVVVDWEPNIVQKLREQDIPAIQGDALDVKTLEKAGVKRAKTIVSALGSDSSNVFLSLTAKELNPAVEVATRAYSEEAIGKLHGAGADIIVLPEIIGGFELAKEALGLERSYLEKLVSRKNAVIKRK